MQARETIYAALFAQLQTINSLPGAGSTFPRVQTFSRRFVPFSRVDLQPAFIMVEFGEQYDKPPARGTPNKVTLIAHLFIYTREPDPNAVSATDLNNLLDAIDQTIGPQVGIEQTLGGLVHVVRLIGRQTIYDALQDITQATTLVEVQMLATT